MVSAWSPLPAVQFHTAMTVGCPKLNRFVYFAMYLSAVRLWFAESILPLGGSCSDVRLFRRERNPASRSTDPLRRSGGPSSPADRESSGLRHFHHGYAGACGQLEPRGGAHRGLPRR